MSSVVKFSRDARRSIGLSSGGSKGGDDDAGTLPLDIINEALGVQQKTVTNPDGSKQVVISQLALSPEEQRLKDSIDATLQSSIDQLSTLSGTDFSDFMDEQVVQDFQAYNTALLDKSFGKATQQQEEVLAQRGLSDSTAATETRAALIGQQANQREEAGLQAINFAQNLRTNRIAEAAQNVNIANALSTGSQANINAGINQSLTASGQGLQAQSLAQNASQFNQQMKLNKQNSKNQLIGSLAGAGAAFAMSDERLKENLVKVGELDNGLNVYVGSYKEETGLDTAPQLFLIAQEVQEVNEDAVVLLDNGYLAVDYRKAVK